MTNRNHMPKSSSDALVVATALLIASMACVMLVFQFLAKSHRAYSSPFFWFETASEVAVTLALALVLPFAVREMRTRRAAAASALDARRQIETLFQMTDMLQSALGYADANAVLRSTAAALLPGFGGALYVFNNSGDRLELSTHWAWPPEHAPAQTISPQQCWALKRGKSHLNEAGDAHLVCEHHDSGIVVLEIPMMARGEVYGLLAFQAQAEGAAERLTTASPIAGALSDAMSLALSNIALRDKLRTQALRDTLTGLYNRRYMEDALERYGSLAERSDNALSLIMIDLDHFKRLNDDHGHAVGDAVLSQVASSIVGGIRACDIAFRYGCEELVVLLPNCSIDEAAAKAENLRARIERLSEDHGMPISASFGVATLPDSSAKAADLLTDADAALYRAKEAGRNCVQRADGRRLASVAHRPTAVA